MLEDEQISVIDINKDEISDQCTKSELRKSILKFTWPCLAELMLMTLISIVNQAMVGHLGKSAIAAVGLTNQPLFAGIAVFQSFNIGATALVARYIGSKEHENAKKVVIQTLIMSLIFGVILSSLGIVFSKSLVIGMGAKADTLSLANMYMKYMAFGFIFQAIPTAVSSILRGAGDTKSPMRYNIISNIVNVLAGIVLIYGLAFIPAFGLEGAAIATTLAKFSACVLSIKCILTTNLQIRVHITDKFRLDIQILKKIMSIGTAAALEQFVMRLGFILYTKIIADLGTASFAAHQVCNSINSISFNFGQALSMAATSFVGRNLGSGKPNLAQMYCDELRKIGLMVAITISVLYFFAGGYLSRIFTTDAEVIALGSMLLKIVILMTPAQNSQLIISGGLRGAGDTKWTLISTLLGLIVIRIPLVLILIKGFNMGVGAAWAAGVIDQYVRYAIVYARFLNGSWKTVTI